jgi:hypothetical protein
MGTDQKLASRYGPYLLLSRLPTDSDTLASHPSEPLFCMFCNEDLMEWSPRDRQSHYEAHLSNLDTLRAH